MINYVLLDLDGTITNPKEGITKSVQYALKHMGIEVEDLDSLCKYIGPPLRESFMEYWGFDQEQAEQAIKYYREYFSKTGILQNEVYPGMEKMLHNLVKAEKQLIVATSKPEIYARQIVDYFGLTKYFKDICGSLLDGTRDKKGEVIQYALENNNIRNLEEAIMVGDRLHDVRGAKENGIASLGVLYGFGCRDELQGEGATYIAQTVEELSELLLRL